MRYRTKSRTDNKSPFQTQTRRLFATIFVLCTTALFLALVYAGIIEVPTPSLFANAQVAVRTTYTVKLPTDIINEDGGQKSLGATLMWFGTGRSTTESYLGIRLTGGSLPAGASILAAKLFLTSANDQWIPVEALVSSEFAINPITFSKSKPASVRQLTGSFPYKENTKWNKGTAYAIDVTNQIKAVAALPGRLDNGPVVIIIEGNAAKPWGRKFFTAKTGTATAPKLVVDYTVASGQAETPAPTQIAAPTAMPSGVETAAPTQQLQPTLSQAAGGDSALSAHAFGLWSPGAHDNCTKAVHDKYFVLGPDGKKYPTWHPPIDPQSGCAFGHEHGRDPRGYQYWEEVRRHFAFDANHDGSISDAEAASAGLPFGYVNEQIEPYFIGAQSSTAFMRHEDHVGHKVEYANGEGDIGDGTDPFDSSTTGGVVVPVKSTTPGRKWDPSGIRCYHLNKIHQGVSTPDAFTNNLHEIMIHTKCTSTRSDFPPSTSLISGMVAFGAPGEFTRFCGDDRNQIITTGKTDANKNFPGETGRGMRNIITRDCVEKTVLVPDGQFSSFPYEIWDGSLHVRTGGGQTIADHGGSWEVLDAIRYYNPNATNKISYSASWCYETLGDRRARGGTCDAMTNYGKITDITWDDPRSDYRGVHRGQYVAPARIHNQGGSIYWYTDPFGDHAQTTPFAGSIRQLISPVTADVVGLFDGDPRIIQRRHNDGNGTVHAPN